MVTATDSLPLSGTISPTTAEEVAAAIRDARKSRSAVYPIGGGTSLDFGLPPAREGVGLSLAGMTRLVDYPARDMTITVEAGITLAALAETLAGERQRLPIDVPQAAQATLGGVVACNTNGPRRYGLGTLRDYVIGIAAVDGHGTLFHGGGRVVKNVAGYDFCKLLTGSLGTLGVITEVTLKVKPLAKRSVLLACRVDNLPAAEPLLAALVHSATTPVAIELLSGPAWRERLDLPAEADAAAIVVGLEGTAAEVDWMQEQLAREWHDQDIIKCQTFQDTEADVLWRELIEFPTAPQAPLVIKASLRPSRVAEFCTLVREIDAQASIMAHAGSGVVMVRFAEFFAESISRDLIARLQPAAAAAGGSVVVLDSEGLGKLTSQAIWGGRDAPVDLMRSIKRQFDPDNILNPGRFVY